MGGIEFIFMEFFRSFKQNLIKNIMLIIMITIGSIMSIILCSYFFDLNEKNETLVNVNTTDNGIWYNAGFLNSDDEELYGNLSSVKGCIDVMGYFESISMNRNNPMYFVDTQQSMMAAVDELGNLLDRADYAKFLSDSHPGPISCVINDEIVSAVELNCINVDYNAYKILGFKTIEGTGITEENTYLKSIKDEVPIVLGNAYSDIIHIGDKLNLSIVGNVYPCRIVGILEENSYCYENGDTNVGQINIDNYIIFPYGIRFQDRTGSETEIRRYAFLDILTLVNGANVFIEDKKGEMSNLIQQYHEIAEEFSLPPLSIQGASLGMNLLRNESKESVEILLVMTVSLICFTMYGLFSTIYDKIQSNRKIYGIYLVNGCSIKMILASYIIEVITIVVPSVLVGLYVFEPLKLGYIVINIVPIMSMVYGIGGMVIIVVSIYVIYMLRKVDTEQLIREE